ncbi:MAG: hypothetical protein HUJ92_02640 [Bacteroidales bacterium]|mgnify:CR=1 FL=1|nr:hypothetical protein [Bacteroidales bacterium]
MKNKEMKHLIDEMTDDEKREVSLNVMLAEEISADDNILKSRVSNNYSEKDKLIKKQPFYKVVCLDSQ